MPLNPAFLDELRGIVGADALVLTTEGRMTYECDMHTFYKGAPDAVVLPLRAEQVQAVVKLCRRARVPIERREHHRRGVREVPADEVFAFAEGDVDARGLTARHDLLAVAHDRARCGEIARFPRLAIDCSSGRSLRRGIEPRL